MVKSRPDCSFCSFLSQMWQDDDTEALNDMQKFGATLSNGLNSSVNVLQSPRRDTPYAPTGCVVRPP
jgi:hypothetical protein